MKRNYHTIDKQGKVNARKLGEFLSNNGLQLLPMVDLIEQCQVACDELIDVAGRATIQTVLALSAEQAADGPRQQGKQRSGEVVWYGRQAGTVMLRDRKLADFDLIVLGMGIRSQVLLPPRIVREIPGNVQCSLKFRRSRLI